MTLRACCTRLGEDYEDIMRLLRTEERVRRYWGMLLRDDTFSTLRAAVADRDFEASFRAAHTLKGVLQNLGLTRLAKDASDLTEALRGRRENGRILPLLEQTERSYWEATAAIAELLGPQEDGGDGHEEA